MLAAPRQQTLQTHRHLKVKKVTVVLWYRGEAPNTYKSFHWVANGIAGVLLHPHAGRVKTAGWSYLIIGKLLLWVGKCIAMAYLRLAAVCSRGTVFMCVCGGGGGTLTEDRRKDSWMKEKGRKGATSCMIGIVPIILNDTPRHSACLSWEAKLTRNHARPGGNRQGSSVCAVSSWSEILTARFKNMTMTTWLLLLIKSSIERPMNYFLITTT